MIRLLEYEVVRLAQRLIVGTPFHTLPAALAAQADRPRLLRCDDAVVEDGCPVGSPSGSVSRHSRNFCSTTLRTHARQLKSVILLHDRLVPKLKTDPNISCSRVKAIRHFVCSENLRELTCPPPLFAERQHHRSLQDATTLAGASCHAQHKKY